ncbi:MAG TPA: methylisocitrate lyase [bacterium]|nr:methylisocitrate lyase [bacterium]
MSTHLTPSPGRRLRELLARKQILMAPGAFDALSAKLIERAGFEAMYMTGGGTVTALAGLPDIGLLSVTEMALNARYIANAVHTPVFADADTGYGNALNVMRTVREYEQAGLAGLHMEDQVSPKRCGHVAGKECILLEEMAGKIRAAVAARSDPDFVIIARTDARAPLGFDEAVKRGRAYAAAGADVIFPEALQTREEFADYARAVRVPLLANMAEFGKTPYLSASEFEDLGYAIVIYATSGLRVALRAMEAFYAELKARGTQTGWLDRMFTRAELYELIGYSRYTEFEREFVGDATDPLA